jgi:anti-sigma B factor antagonist
MPGPIAPRRATRRHRVRMNLQLKPRWVGEVMVLTCAGRIVVGPEVDSLYDTVSRELEHQPNIVLQTADVQFVDSSGLGTMVRLMSAARKAGGDVKICQPPAMMRKALTMTNLHNVFQIYETEAEAILAALHMRSPAADLQADQSRPAVLCVDPSPDVLAYLSELLKKEGLRPITASNLVDAQVLMKARAPKLILANARLSARGQSAGEIFAGCCPGVIFLDLGEAFSTDDAGEAGSRLLANIRALV